MTDALYSDDLSNACDETVLTINQLITKAETVIRPLLPFSHSPAAADEFAAAVRNLTAARDALITIERYQHPEGL